MFQLPRSVTAAGLLVAVAAVLVDPSAAPWLASLLGEHAATKLAAVGALISSFGRALTEKAAATPPEA